MPGIDASNIVEGGRGSRRAAAPAVDYKALLGPAGSDDSDDSAEDSDQEDGSDVDLAMSQDDVQPVVWAWRIQYGIH